MIWVWITAGSRGGVPRRWGRKASAAPSAAAIGRLTTASKIDVAVASDASPRPGISAAGCAAQAATEPTSSSSKATSGRSIR